MKRLATRLVARVTARAKLAYYEFCLRGLKADAAWLEYEMELTPHRLAMVRSHMADLKRRMAALKAR